MPEFGIDFGKIQVKFRNSLIKVFLSGKNFSEIFSSVKRNKRDLKKKPSQLFIKLIIYHVLFLCKEPP